MKKSKFGGPIDGLVLLQFLVGAHLLSFAFVTASLSDPVHLAATGELLTFTGPTGDRGITISSSLGSFCQPAPIAIKVINQSNTTTWIRAGYQSVRSFEGSSAECKGSVTTSNGSKFAVFDHYVLTKDRSAVIMTRDIEVRDPSKMDSAFNSQFSLTPSQAERVTDYDFFIPGVLYKDNALAPPSALAANPTDTYQYIREDRLPLPVVMMRQKSNGLTLIVAHLSAVPSTVSNDYGRTLIVDSRLQYGSIGIANIPSPSPTFNLPGDEGQRTYGGGSVYGWTYRSHPVVRGVVHRYSLLIKLEKSTGFPDAIQSAWRTVAGTYWPPDEKVDIERIYQDEIDLLNTYTTSYYGCVGVPFAAKASTGEVIDTSSEMGFVGKALPAAELLLANAVEIGKADQQSRATAVIDFWVHHCLSPGGVMRTWYDVHPDGSITWRDYHAFFRNTVDGAEAVLQSYDLLHRAGTDKTDWLSFCVKYGDWLVAHQGSDGSWAREYDFYGNPVNAAKDTTIQAVPILVDLYKETGNVTYKAAALKAGEYCLNTVQAQYQYEGGTPDNPNVLDKESGMMALTGFLALNDLTNDTRWLPAIVQAADFAETWTYMWNIPIPSDDRQSIFPQNRMTNGLSIIATGHSGADTYMADAPFLYYRTYLLTGDRQYARFADFTLHNTKMLMDYDGTLGYRYRGSQTEALTVGPARGHGITSWLPWLATTQLEPLTLLKSVFGSMDIGKIEKEPKSIQLAQETNYARTHGLTTVDGLN